MLKQKLTSWFKSGGAGAPLYLVGGSVRDFVLGRPMKDIDLACPNARELAKKLAKANNAAFVPMEKDPAAPCFRVVNRSDPTDFLDVVRFRGPDIHTDLADRDFTINAMALDLENGFPQDPMGAILDPFNGLDDIRKQIIRSLGRKNLKDDPLRILRAFRFASQLGFEIEEKTLADCRELAPQLERTAAERITHELITAFEAENSYSVVRKMWKAGVLLPIFPDIAPMEACQQDGFHHHNVWEHSLDVYEALEGVLGGLDALFGEYAPQVRECLEAGRTVPMLKLSALLHDIGKPYTGRYDEAKGRTTFFGHAKKGEALARKALGRLRLTNKDMDFVCLLVSEHRHVEQLAQPVVKHKTRMAWYRKMGDFSVACAVLAMADNLSKQGRMCTETERSRREKHLMEMVREYFAEAKGALARPLLINGNDLLEIGLPKGPGLGKVLKAVTAAQDAGQVKTKEQALALAKNLHRQIK
ncbi:polynucleotide adenylyltransferase/metal dependent phosphohydrolase [Desulfatibacillum aliphaticivorans]|uniref:Polynucleotide adenylyltransferase/metal dependent phosphohydrolase n=1 Tax=Desulfatibacillum aliphaticivorans TaxID=218208 RepID=B8FBG8_DESAL|nr:HD domain-containing protein [Desulfatibacillum aliphaticivorans]ACL04612.1 polynucleotide adenylyltransferase/metal dependent phosphohydrolase [Desulfatibacillum aliphaticivorans]